MGNLLTSWARRPLPPSAHSAHRSGRPSGAAVSPPRLAPHPQLKTTQGAHAPFKNPREQPQSPGKLPTPQGLFLLGLRLGDGVAALPPAQAKLHRPGARSALRGAGPHVVRAAAGRHRHVGVRHLPPGALWGPGQSPASARSCAQHQTLRNTGSLSPTAEARAELPAPAEPGPWLLWVFGE